MAKKVTFTVATLLFGLMAFSQPIRKSKSKNDSTSFKIQTNYLSNYVYNGRADSLKTPYFYTSATVNFANGIYASFSLNYLVADGQNRFDFSELDLGYNYAIGQKVSGEIYGSKYFYTSQSNLLSGNISSDIGFTFNYDLNFLNFHNSTDVFFADKADFQIVPGLEKEIIISDHSKDIFSITPGIYGSFSSLNFYESTVSRRLNAIKGPKLKQPINTGTLQSTTFVNNKGFKFLDVELSMPLSYDYKNWNFTLTPTYAIPFNKIYTTSINTTTINGIPKTSTLNSTPFSENNLNNIFFVDLGISFNF